MEHLYKILKNTAFTIQVPKLFRFLFTVIILLIGNLLHSQTTVTFSAAGTTTWTVPAGVTIIDVKCWGAGGAGGGSTSNNNGGSGGGGGGYTFINSVAVTPGDIIPYTIGLRGAGSTGNGTAGGNSSILTLTAFGGGGGAANRGAIGLGGSATGGPITVGNNGTLGTNDSGDGGDGANGGNGGNGGNNGANGGVGANPGGGGGGGDKNSSSSNRTGGNGGLGQITITYRVFAPITFTPSSGCSNPGATVIITGTNFTSPATVTFNGVASTNVTVNSATRITAIVPIGATTGKINVTTAYGSVTSAANFTVFPVPTIAPIIGSNEVCVLGTTTLTCATSGTWSCTPAAIATINSGGVVSGVSAGNAVVKYTVTDSNGCVNSVDYPITVNSRPTLSGPAVVCPGSQIQLTSASSGIWSGGNSSATIDPLTGIVSGLSGGTTTFTFTTTGTNCQNTKTIIVYTLPAITSQPVALSRCSGTSATFTTVGSGTGVTYQWYKDGNPISLATSSSYSIPSVTVSNAGNYHCVVSGSCTPAVTSDIVALTVTEAVSITSQPVSIQKCTNEIATFSVTAGGAVFGYQWYKDGNPISDSGTISGATTSLLTISSPVALDAGIYRCQILGTGPCPALNSANATLIVYQLPAIITQPVGLSRCSGTSATFTVGSSGTGITFQWFKDGNPISFATNSSYNIPSATISDSGNYHCVVSGTCTPSVISDIVPLTVTQALGISANPISLQKCINDTANFSVTATGSISGYQWYKDGIALVNGGNISGATASALVITSLASGDVGIYHCEIIGTGPCPSLLSANAALIVNVPPVITNQTTTTQVICFGQSASFTVTATGGNLVYQWYNGATALNSSTPNISGWNTATLTINPANVSDTSASYYCVVSNACSATATTTNMALIVNSKPVIPNQNTAVCSGLPFAVEPVNGVPTASTVVPLNTIYSWSAPAVTGGITGGTAQSGQPVISDTLINPGTTSETATYTVTPVSGTSGNCIGNSFTVVVTVNPMPYIINLSPTTCSGEIFSVTPVHGSGNFIPPGTTYS